MDRLGIGIIGFGRIGAEHAGWLARSTAAHVVAVADATLARQALAAGRGIKSYDSVDLLLADPAVEAVLVATPTAMHFDHASHAIARGKHVMIEKPMALDLHESQILAAEAAIRSRVLSVFHNRRWDVDFLTVKQAVDSGALGKIINVESRLGQWGSCVGPAAREYRPTWRNEAAFGGGGLYDWGSHFIDQLWQLMFPASPVRIFAQLRGNVWTKDCDDFARVLINFDNGAVGMVEINTTTTRPGPRWHVDGTKGSASSPFSPEFDTKTWAKLELTQAGTTDRRTFPTAAPGLTELDLWTRFAAACRGQGEPAVSVQSVLTTMKLLDAARKSSADGAAVGIEA